MWNIWPHRFNFSAWTNPTPALSGRSPNHKLLLHWKHPLWVWSGYGGKNQCPFTKALRFQCCWNPVFLLLRMWDSNFIYWCESVHKWHYHYKWKWEKSGKCWLWLWEMNSCHAPASVKCSICTCVCKCTHMHPYAHTHTLYPLLANLRTYQLSLGTGTYRDACSITQLCLTLWTLWNVAHQAPLTMGFPRQECWSGLPFPFPKV